MVELLGRTFALPKKKTVVFCIDGCEPEYLDRALEDGLMPRLKEALDAGGTYVRGRGQMPSFTNPNNLSIVTGQPTRVHGICGNTYWDEEKKAEAPMNERRFLQTPTLLDEMELAGVRTLCVTAKDKLRALLGKTAYSAEKAPEDVEALVGRKKPSIYDWDISHYAMEMGLALHERLEASLLYVSLTDYVQHKDPPRGEMANRFYRRFDELLGAYVDAGFVCAMTADHGMNDKTRPDGSPNVRFLEDVLGAAGVKDARVLLPITDPYVVHHGALGSFATVYVRGEDRERAQRAIAAEEGVEEVLTREAAAERFLLPADRIGDLVVLGDKHTVLGKSAAKHDLSAVTKGLRSHGGLHEATVPIVVCAPLASPPRRDVSNADIFDLVLNGVR